MISISCRSCFRFVDCDGPTARELARRAAHAPVFEGQREGSDEERAQALREVGHVCGPAKVPAYLMTTAAPEPEAKKPKAKRAKG